MSKAKFWPLLACLALSLTALPNPPALAVSYTYDQEYSRVEFFLKHLGLPTAEGYFKSFSGTSRFSSQEIEKSEVTIKISTASIQANSKARTESLRSEKFFWPEKHPLIQFVSRKFIKINASQFDIEGDLTIRGITRPAVFQTEMLTKAGSMTDTEPLFFTASTFIKRKDYRLGTEDWSNPLLFLTQETLEIRLEVKCIPEKTSKSSREVVEA